MPGNLKEKKKKLWDKRSFRQGQIGYGCYKGGNQGTLSREE